MLLLSMVLISGKVTAESLVTVERSADLSLEAIPFSLLALLPDGEARSIPVSDRSRFELSAATWAGDVPLPEGVPEGACLVARGANVWSRPACPKAGSYRVELIPGALLHLRAEGEVPEGTLLPDALVAQAWRRRLGDGVSVPCERVPEETFWSCTGPAEPIDLRVELPGFAPAFSWSVPVDSGPPVETVTIGLTRGASVDGWIDGPPGVVRLLPAGRWDGPAQERLAFIARDRSFGDDGHLHFGHVAPGVYELEVESPERAIHRTTFEVAGDDQRVVLPDIALATLRRVDLVVEPPVDGYGEPWQVQLSPAGRAQGEARTVSTDLSGWAAIDDLALGDYLLVVSDSQHSVWQIAHHEVDESATLSVSIPRVEVEGSISAGEELVRTTLVFGTTQGSTRISLRSDEKGRFRGFLPREGRWEVEMGSLETGCGTCEGELGVVVIPPVEVEAGPSGKAFVDIRLPDTKLRGRVVRQAGQEVVPVPGARLLVVRADGERERRGRKVQLWTEDDGTFDIRGLEPGPLRVAALLPGNSGESDWVRVDLLDGVRPPDVELTIREKVPLNVSLAARGAPVAGARVLALPEQGLSVDGVTDLDGRSTLRVPAGSAGPLLIEAIGRGLWLGRYQAEDGLEAGGGPEGGIQIDLTQPPGELLLEGVASVPLPSWLMARGGSVSLNVIRSLLPGHLEPADGGLLLKAFVPGRYSLCLWQSGRCSEVTIPPGGRVQIQRSRWEKEGNP